MSPSSAPSNKQNANKYKIDFILTLIAYHIMLKPIDPVILDKIYHWLMKWSHQVCEHYFHFLLESQWCALSAFYVFEM